MSSIISKLLDISGLTGGGTSANSIIPNRNPQSVQTQFDKDGEVANPDVWDSYNSVMTRPRTYEESLRVWDEMSHWDLISAALTEITDEACQSDSLSPGLIWAESPDQKIEDEVNSMLQEIGAEDILPSQTWNVAGFGNDFGKLDYAPEKGVMGLSEVHPMEMRRYWLARNRKCIGFRWMNQQPEKDHIFDFGGTSIERAKLNVSGRTGGSMENLFYPWDFLHIRRMHRSRISEHGQPMFDDAIGIYKKLRMAIDQMTVHRAMVQPDRYVVNIDTKDLPPMEAIKVVNHHRQMMRSKLSFGSGAGGFEGKPDEFKSFYNTFALDSVLWMAKPRDSQHSIDKVAGTSSVPDVYDIELLINLFFSIIGMPKSWIGLGGNDGEGGPASGKALLAQDMRFLRKIKTLRAPIIASYRWLAYFHLLLKGVDVSTADVRIKMPPIGSLEDQMKLEMLKSQAEVLDLLADIMPKYNLPREVWIDVIFKRYMKLPDDIVDAFMTALPPEAAAQEEGKKFTRQDRKDLFEDLAARVGPHKESFQGAMSDILSGNAPSERLRKYRTSSDVLKNQVLVEGDLVLSGYGQANPLTDFSPSESRPTTVTERLTSHPGYRSMMDHHIRTEFGSMMG